MIKEKKEYYKLLIQMALPILINYVVTTLFEILDKAIVGNYSTEGFAAVGIAGSVIYAITGSFGILSVAYNIIAAEHIGKGDDKAFKDAFKASMNIAIIVGIGVIIISLIGGKFIFKRLFLLDDNILNQCLGYFYISSVTVLLNMIIFTFSVYFRNLKNTKISLYSAIVATVTNIVFDYSLVYGKFGLPELGVKGAAVGSVIGLITGIIVYAIKFCRQEDISVTSFGNKKTLKRIVALYIPLLGQDVMECTVFTFMITGIVSRLGLYEIASYSLSESISSIIALPIFAFSSSAMTLSLQKTYAGEERTARDILNTAIKLSCVMVLLMGIIVVMFPKVVFGVICNDKIVISRATNIFIIVIVVQFLNVFHQILKNYLQGINCEQYVIKHTIIISLISICWIGPLSNFFSLYGVYMGIGINYFILAMLYYFRMKKYRE